MPVSKKSLVKESGKCCYSFIAAQKAQIYNNAFITCSLVSPLWPIGTELFPGPGQYDMELDSIGKDKKQNKYGFQSSADARPKEVADYDMSPTKYRPELGPIYCPLGCGHKSVFK